jgi:thymidylate synthase
MKLYKKFLKKIKKYGKIVYVNSKKTKELVNVYWSINLKKDEYLNKLKKASNIQPPHIDDQKERDNILSIIKNKFNLLKNDKNTRQFVIQKTNSDNTPSCVPLIQFLIRNKKLYCFVHFRSQNINNFNYDLMSILYYCNPFIEIHDLHIKKIKIIVTIGSLHKYLN